MQQKFPVLTVGHSTHGWESFANLLSSADVTAIADVRTTPYSRHTPQFNRDELSLRLKQLGIAYVFLGKELGGRPQESKFFSDGVADYEKMAGNPCFKKGLARVIEGTQKYRIALLCSEREPLDCHRCLLVGRQLFQLEISVGHILHNGTIESHESTEERLLHITQRQQQDFFTPRGERLVDAYRQRGRMVAYSEVYPASKDREDKHGSATYR